MTDIACTYELTKARDRRRITGPYKLSSRERRELAKCKSRREEINLYNDFLAQERRGHRRFLYKKYLKILTAMRLAKKRNISTEEVNMCELPTPALLDRVKAWWFAQAVETKYETAVGMCGEPDHILERSRPFSVD